MLVKYKMHHIPGKNAYSGKTYASKQSSFHVGPDVIYCDFLMALRLVIDISFVQGRYFEIVLQVSVILR